MKFLPLICLLVIVSCGRVKWVDEETFSEVSLRSNGIIDIATCLMKSTKVKKVVDDVIEMFKNKKFDAIVLIDAIAAFEDVKKCIAGPKITKFQEVTLTEVCDIRCKLVDEQRTCNKSCAPRKN